MSGGNIASQH